MPKGLLLLRACIAEPVLQIAPTLTCLTVESVPHDWSLSYTDALCQYSEHLLKNCLHSVNLQILLAGAVCWVSVTAADMRI